MADGEDTQARKKEELRLRQSWHKKDPESFGDLIGGNEALLTSYAGNAPKGVFATHTGATPKYNTNPNQASESMARLMVPFSSDTARERFVKSLPDGSARNLGDALALTGNTAHNEPKGVGTDVGMGYVDFLLQTAQESYREKVQVVDVLSDNYIAYFFGQEPPIFSYQGMLLNTYQDDWRSAFSIIYGEILRGTKLARRRRLMTLTYDNVAVTGTIISMTQNLTADMEMAASFTFNILVKRYDVYRLPNTEFNPPTKFTSVLGKLIDPNTFTGLKLGRIKKSYRTFGEPQIATSTAKKNKGDTSRSESDAMALQRTPAEEQKDQNVRGGHINLTEEGDCDPSGQSCVVAG